MNAIKRTKGLGRGLEALLGPSGDDANKDMGEQVMTLPLGKLQAGKYQPRSRMDESSLMELAESIKSQGIMQPILVRPIGSGKYEIIAGERRFRASKMAGLEEVPVLVRAVPDESALAMALIENIQREDLNAIEEARALSRLQEEFNLTQQEVADAVGKSRTTVTNLLRLISLSEEVRKMLETKSLEMGHARALLSLPANDQYSVAKIVVSKHLSVRQTEELVRRTSASKKQNSSKQKGSGADIKSLENKLSERIGANVSIQHTVKGKGKLVISYNDLEELEGILNHIR